MNGSSSPSGIDTETANDLNYQLGLNNFFGSADNSIIIDADGRVVEVITGIRRRENELEFRKFLEAVMQQNK